MNVKCICKETHVILKNGGFLEILLAAMCICNILWVLLGVPMSLIWILTKMLSVVININTLVVSL